MLFALVAIPVQSKEIMKDKTAFDYYHQGKYEKAALMWSKSALEGNSIAMTNLGVMYDNGYGIPKNHENAFRLFTLAAKNGNATARYNLANMYLNGKGTQQDTKKAVKWYQLAAYQNEPNSQFMLGVLYSDGTGVIQDYITAHMWFNIAAQNGQNPEGRETLALKMTPSQIEKAQNKAREWFDNLNK